MLVGQRVKYHGKPYRVVRAWSILACRDLGPRVEIHEEVKGRRLYAPRVEVCQLRDCERCGSAG